jgi:ubiquinol-cytochrome c reductase cytochrome c subunit
VKRLAAFALAAAGAAAAVVLLAPQGGSAQDQELARQGRQLFVEGCSSCHGLDAKGITGVGPSLVGVGAEAADFYLSTGRMPLKDKTGEEPLRAEPAYPPDQLRALVAYVGSLGGPRVPDVHPEQGSIQEGLRAYTSYCAGCHQIVGEGGVVTGAIPPPLKDATPTQIAEAVRVGPYVMPAFGEQTIDDPTLDSIIRYVELTQDPDDRGGWGIGHIGPVPEGLVAWLIGLAALLMVARLIGERSE